jgi:hypothetical protein
MKKNDVAARLFYRSVGVDRLCGLTFTGLPLMTRLYALTVTIFLPSSVLAIANSSFLADCSPLSTESTERFLKVAVTPFGMI